MGEHMELMTCRDEEYEYLDCGDICGKEGNLHTLFVEQS